MIFRKFRLLTSFASLALIVWLSALGGCNSAAEIKFFENINNNIAVGRYNKATQDLITFINTYPKSTLTSRALFKLASIHHLYLNNPSQAIRHYQTLARSYKTSDYHKPALKGLADLYWQSKPRELNKVIAVFEALITTFTKFDNEWLLVQLKLGDAYLENDQPNQARFVFRRIINKAPLQPNQEQVIAFAYFKIGYSFELTGMERLAMLTYQEIENITDQSRDSLYSAIRIAEIYEKNKKSTQAQKTYRSILKRLKSDDPLYKVYLARTS